MVTDFHTHCFPDELAERAMTTLQKISGIKPYCDGTLGGIIDSMAKSGVDRSVVLSIATKPSQTTKINDWTIKIKKKEIIPFGSIHPDYAGWRQELDKLHRNGIKGIKFHPDYQNFYVEDKKLFPIYEYAFSLGMIVLFHAGVDIGFKPPYHCTPEGLACILDSFPGGIVVAAHMGGFSYWDEVERLLVGRDIFFDTSYSVKWLGDARTVKMITDHGYEKVLFGTDSPWRGQDDELARIKSIGLDNKVLDAVLGGNAARLLGEEL